MLLQSATPAFIAKIQAAQLEQASLRFDRMGAGVTASASDPILVVFTPTSTATEAKFVITWHADFTVSGTHSTSTTGLPSEYQGEILTAVPTLGATGTAASQTVTYTTGDLSGGTLYGFYITGGVQNPGTSGAREVTLKTTTSADAEIDSSTVTVGITEANADQVSVTASVGSSFNFALDPTNAVADTTYYFRLVKSDGTPLDTYTRYATITVSSGGGGGGPNLSQLMRHGKWFNSTGVRQPFTF